MIIRFGVYSIIALCFSTLSVVAKDLPKYDPVELCAEISELSGNSSIFNICINQQQQYYDELKVSWSNYPAKIQKYCDDVGRIAGGNYIILATCLQQQVEAEKNKPGFKF